MTGADWVLRLGLATHPEGGWFRRIYTDARALGDRPLASSIHYLLAGAMRRGRMHRNRSTILHFLQSGGPVDYTLVDASGPALVRLGPGDDLFLAVPGGVWKGSALAEGVEHALVSEVVLPGFDWRDHEYLDAGGWQALHARWGDALRPWQPLP